MLGKTHRLGGIGFGIGTVQLLSLVSIVLNPISAVGYVSGSALGSLIPDIDHQGSTLGKQLKPVSKAVSKIAGHRGATHYPITCVAYTIIMVCLSKVLASVKEFNMITGILVALLFSFTMTPLIKLIIKSFHIRLNKAIYFGLPYILVILGLVVVFNLKDTAILFTTSLLLGSCMGYLSHLILDAFTVAGIPLFGPAVKTNFRLTKAKTGGGIEIFGIVLSIIVAIVGNFVF